MNLPSYGLANFERFMVSNYAVEWASSEFAGELKRCIVKERLIIIRQHEIRRTADSIEVFCSDKDLIRIIENEFLFWLENDESNQTEVERS